MQTNCPSAIVPLFCAGEDTSTCSGKPHSLHANHSANLGSIFLQSFPTFFLSAPLRRVLRPCCLLILRQSSPERPRRGPRSLARKYTVHAPGRCAPSVPTLRETDPNGPKSVRQSRISYSHRLPTALFGRCADSAHTSPLYRELADSSTVTSERCPRK